MGVVSFGIAQTLCLTRSTTEISCRALANQ